MVLIVLVLAAAVWYGALHHRTLPASRVPRTLEEFKQQPGGALTVEAGDFLMRLAKEGKLPGFARGEHGTMHAGILDAKAETPSSATAEGYPVSRVIHFQKEGDTSDYFYIVERESREAPWKLQEAWRTDAAGRIMETYSVP